ncbi:Protein phosphatase 2C [Legionella nautarum]|uniref:Protein phosphatase 2C n=1 Tax=Legionella nautarum TaxID=45070 RepID=A0A0W0WUD4_9GAMM|nr:PP2C family serine/threonine-protein phosphatase [Legionella nautarum]KTD35750.1 Protein phosphatase 2C [Legionella nautarum]
MAKIFSIPPFPDETTGANEDSQFGYFECQHGPTPRQNAVAWETLTCKDLTPEGKTQQLAPQKIAARLWTAHRLVDEESKIMLTDTTDPSKEHKSRQSGSAASTTIYDGKGNLITATLGDTSAFLVFYDYEGNPMAARRLNSVIHRLDNLDEYARIKKEGGIIAHDKLVLRENDAEISSLAVSRAMGSEQFKKSGVCANSNLDIVNLAEAAKDLGIAQEKIAKTQVISVCHCFNEAAGTNNQTKEGHENHLLSALKELDTPATSQEADLARLLIERVKPNTSDNLSVAIQTINKDMPAFLLGLYGGQQGVVVSALAAYFTGDFFKKQCALTGEAYATQKLSVNSNKLVYKRDNPDLFNESEYKAIVLKLSALTRTYQKNLDSNGSEHIAPLLKLLVAILENPYETNKTKIKKFYDFLDSPHSTTALKNIEILKQDEKIPTLNFILGICFVLISLATFIIPSLFISGLVLLR